MLEFLKKEWKYLSTILVIFLVMGFVYYLYQDYKTNFKQVTASPSKALMVNTDGDKSSSPEAKVVYLEGKGTNTKEIVYVPKETEPDTGLAEKTDVQFERRKTKIYVKINGKEYEVPSTVQEEVTFSKGKLVVAEQTQTKIEITAPKPKMNIGVGWSKNGLAAQLNGPLYKNVSWWMYGDKKTFAGGIQFPIAR